MEACCGSGLRGELKIDLGLAILTNGIDVTFISTGFKDLLPNENNSTKHKTNVPVPDPDP